MRVRIKDEYSILTRINFDLSRAQGKAESRRATTRAEDEIIMDARIDSSMLGGSTVRRQPAQHLPASKLAYTWTAIDQDKRIRLLAREQGQLQYQLEWMIQKAVELGLEWPE